MFLRYFAERLHTVEINNTFYRMPTAKLVEGWAEQVPEGFTFAVKAPQRITHIAPVCRTPPPRPRRSFVTTVSKLGPRLGPLLFQLPPFMKKDVPASGRLPRLVGAQGAPRSAFEFRHASWSDDEVWAPLLRQHGVALCVAEGESLESPLVATADWGYVRLRRDEYPDAPLVDGWAERIPRAAVERGLRLREARRGRRPVGRPQAHRQARPLNRGARPEGLADCADQTAREDATGAPLAPIRSASPPAHGNARVGKSFRYFSL